MSGSGIAVALAVLAGLAGAVQVALMSQLGDRISVVGALAFATLFTAVAAFLILVIAKRSLSAYVDAFHQPWWILMGGLMGQNSFHPRWKAASRQSLSVAQTTLSSRCRPMSLLR